MFIYIYYLFWDHLGEWDQLGSHFIYRNRDDTVSYKSNHNVLPSYKSGCKWFRGLQWPSRWYRESRKLPRCSCKSRRRLWWFRDAVIVTTIISQIATWSQWIKIVIAHLTIANEIYIDVQIHMVSRNNVCRYRFQNLYGLQRWVTPDLKQMRPILMINSIWMINSI